MKLKKLFLVLILISMLIVPVVALAADTYGLEDAVTATGGAIPKTIGPNNSKDVPEVIGEVIGIGLSLIGVLFFALMLYGGLYWMIAKGDSGKVDKAKEIMEAAIIGLIIISGAYAISNFVFTNVVGGSGSTSANSTAGGTTTQPK